MSQSFDFTAHYKSLSNVELLLILLNKVDYQPTAIEAAKRELQTRNVSAEEQLQAQQQFNDKQQKVTEQKEKIEQLEQKLKSTGVNILESLNPIQTGINSTERTIRTLTILFTIVFLYNIRQDLRSASYILRNFSNFPIVGVMSVIPIFLLPIGIILFALRKFAGWILLNIMTVYWFISMAWLLLYAINRPASSSDTFFPAPSIVSIVVTMICQMAIIIIMTRKKIREIFQVNEFSMILGIVGGVLLTLFTIFVAW